MKRKSHLRQNVVQQARQYQQKTDLKQRVTFGGIDEHQGQQQTRHREETEEPHKEIDFTKSPAKIGVTKSVVFLPNQTRYTLGKYIEVVTHPNTTSG